MQLYLQQFCCFQSFDLLVILTFWLSTFCHLTLLVIPNFDLLAADLLSVDVLSVDLLPWYRLLRFG
jgi:hypothetical protein